MRKALAVLIGLFLIISISGCSAAPFKSAKIIFSFTGSAQIKQGDSEIVCTIMRAAPKSASIAIQSPKELSGLTYTWGSSFSSVYAGITNKSAECDLPQNCFAPLLIKVLDAAEKPDALCRENNSTLSGSTDQVSYVLTIDGSSGFIQKIEIPRYQICAVFTRCQKIT